MSRVRCRSNQLLNPETGRCVDKDGVVGKSILLKRFRSPCGKKRIRNPSTGRCVKRSGKIGQEIIQRARVNRLRRSRSAKRKQSCARGSIYNPATGKCVKRSGKIGQEIIQRARVNRLRRSRSANRRKQSCGRGKVYNPARGNCVSRTRAKSRAILRSTQRRSCKRTEIRNPSTGRCVKRTGIIGKAILQRQRSRSKRRRKRSAIRSKQHHRIEPLQEEYSDKITDTVFHIFKEQFYPSLRVIRLVGEGVNGSVYEVHDNKHGTYVIKVGYIGSTNTRKERNALAEMKSLDVHEYKMHLLFQQRLRAGWTPKVFYHHQFLCGQKLYSATGMSIVQLGMMEDRLAIRQTNEDILNIVQHVRMLLQEMCANNLVHGDLHWGNIGIAIATNPRHSVTLEGVRVHPVLIDFGWSSEGPCNPTLEIMQLMSCLYGEPILEVNRKRLIPLLYALLKEFEPKQNIKNQTQGELRRRYLQAMNRYELKQFRPQTRNWL